MPTRKTCLAYTCLLAAAVSVTAGCWDSGHGVVPVAGTVTIDGQPLTVGQVMVSPPGHRPSVGPLDSSGRFQLSCYERGDGAPTGTYAASVMAVEQIGERTLRWHAPKRYANSGRSGIMVTVDGPTDDIKIDLTWEGDRKKGPFLEKF